MTVRTEQGEVCQAVILVIPVAMFEFEWNRLSVPFPKLTARTLVYKDPFSKESGAQPMRGDREAVVEVGAQGSFGAKLAPATMALATKVRGVEAELLHVALTDCIVASIGSNLKLSEDPSNRRRGLNSTNQLFLAIFFKSHLDLSLKGVETIFSKKKNYISNVG